MNEVSSKQQKLDFLRKYCTLLESQFTIPGTKFSFGLDPLLNLIPGLGSYSGLILGSIFIVLAHHQGVSGKVKLLMIRNIFIDFVFGIIPLFGTVSDFFYKANIKNLTLLEEHINEEKHMGSGWQIVVGIALFLMLTLGLSVVACIWILQWLFSV